MECALMARGEYAVRIAWWVRPALVVAMAFGCFSEKLCDEWIDAIVDRGIRLGSD
jgi:hypothetical protein